MDFPTKDENEPKAPRVDTCLRCGIPISLVKVAGHWQCRACGWNAEPCCED